MRFPRVQPLGARLALRRAPFSAWFTAWFAAWALAAGLAAFLAVMPGGAAAGAWTAREGASFTSISNGMDPDGRTGFRRDLYYEHGWAEAVTVGFNVNQQQTWHDEAFSGRVEGFLRQRIWEGAKGDVAAVQVEFGGGIGKAEIDDRPDSAARVLYGRGFGGPLEGAWVEGSLGWRRETGGDSDRALAVAAAGLHLTRDTMAMTALEADMRGDRASEDWEVLRLTATVAHEFRPGARIAFRMATPLIGRRMEEGVNLRIGVWRNF
ncbi:hypothetical protein SAMN05444336_104302 [Albimonas donghaensis]|uniref:Uncharacterized protein n=1 Tax=Albimonas donghaensis TaxID=356660 RepID=A0A1H3AS13_9RHOB|nr:hypothetical protein [Albimonas donghaensis]SDX32492.1 hypothetical protein SAMN05444336_104302 [Albimonas donghaensis]